jgi:hypothetical protein
MIHIDKGELNVSGIGITVLEELSHIVYTLMDDFPEEMIMTAFEAGIKAHNLFGGTKDQSEDAHISFADDKNDFIKEDADDCD